MTTSESKGRFFYRTNRFESIRITNRIESIRIANWNALTQSQYYINVHGEMNEWRVTQIIKQMPHILVL